MQINEIAAGPAKLVISDLWHAVRTERTVQIMLLFLVLTLVGWNMPYVDILLYPFKLFVTTIHEACHALAARLTGGTVASISIAPDESGLTLSLGGIRPIVIMAGYLGASVFGGLLIWWGRKPQEARFVLQSIGSVILALTVFYGGGGVFSFGAMFLIGLAILYIARKAPDVVCHMFLLMLAVQTTLNAIIDLEVLFLVAAQGGTKSDAESMAELTGIPGVVWSVLWGLVSVGILIFSLWISYRPSKKKITDPLTGADMGVAGR